MPAEQLHLGELVQLIADLLARHEDDRIASVTDVEGENAVEVERFDGSVLVVTVDRWENLP